MQTVSERIVLTIWIGGMWTVGYIVAPTLFAMLDDRVMAGSIAGRLFTIMSFIGLFSAMFLLITLAIQDGKQLIQQWRSWLLVAMIIIILLGEFWLQPQMSALRDNGISESEKARFGMLHGAASVLFLINSLSGLILLIFGLRKQK